GRQSFERLSTAGVQSLEKGANMVVDGWVFSGINFCAHVWGLIAVSSAALISYQAKGDLLRMER
ncbi:MAG TPA: hypothetical protein VM574_09255, partial [Terrimicrobiaceae bacterium]|nr:hypothetical protein [Terrimicrobiaceae bacterium]